MNQREKFGLTLMLLAISGALAQKFGQSLPLAIFSALGLPVGAGIFIYPRR